MDQDTSNTSQACCNIDANSAPCLTPASGACKSCYLVQYCGKKCQTAHWPAHKADCKSPLNKATWRPGWEREARLPSFITTTSIPGRGPHGITPFGGKKYFWGNMPALNVLNLQENEGLETRDWRILFAASGDCRNMFKTIACLPASYNGTFELVMNDRDVEIVARNSLLVMTAFWFSPADAAQMMLHLWYSAFLPASMLDTLKETLSPMIQDVCAKIASRSPATLQRKTWSNGCRSICLALRKAAWNNLQSYLNVPDSLTFNAAKDLRTAVTLAEGRKDYVDRAIFRQPPAKRVAMMRFREDGLLLPFGSPRAAYDTPNPTFFHKNSQWPMNDSADPLEGWPSCEISDRATHASNDVYGHLNTYLYRTFLQFCQTCVGLKITIRLFQEDLVDLPQVLREGGQSEGGFDRIEVFGTVIPLRHDVTKCFEVSNTVDKGYVGTAGVLARLGPLLRHPSENQHACLIGLYINATHEVSTAADEVAPLMVNISRMRRYIAINQAAVASRDKYNADLLNFSDAKGMFKDFDDLFKRYVQKERFEDICRLTGLLLKAKNTVIDPWPLRLPAEATQKEFDDLHQSAHDGGEHYVEWKRTV